MARSLLSASAVTGHHERGLDSPVSSTAAVVVPVHPRVLSLLVFLFIDCSILCDAVLIVFCSSPTLYHL